MRPTWSSRGLSEEARVNVTPLIDVVMCLIVFYLMVGHLVIVRRGQTDLPETRVGLTAARDTDPLAITVLPDSPGRVEIDGVEMDIDRIRSVVSGRRDRDIALAVQVRADRGSTFGQIEPVLAACREAGVSSVELATRQAGSLGGSR